jgi:putative transcriptional regulator
MAELRKEIKISQTELADAVFVTRQTITSIEIGKYTASLELAYKIANYFGKTIEDIFDFSEQENHHDKSSNKTTTRSDY